MVGHWCPVIGYRAAGAGMHAIGGLRVIRYFRLVLVSLQIDCRIPDYTIRCCYFILMVSP